MSWPVFLRGDRQQGRVEVPAARSLQVGEIVEEFYFDDNALAPRLDAERVEVRNCMPLEAHHSRASHTYVLDAAGKPRREHNQERWVAWMQGNDQPLAETLLAAAGVRVATRFLGMDQRHNKIGPPVLWETTIFGGLHDLHQERYTSQTAALKGHAKAVAFAKNQAAEMQGSDSATAMPASQAADRE